MKRLYPLLMFALALTLRFVALNDLAVADPSFYTLPEGTDQRGYVAQAEGVLAGTWPDGAFYFQPLYPFILAGYMKVVGSNLYNVRALQLVTGSLGVLVCYGFTAKIYGQRAAEIASAVYAIYPVFIFYDLTLLTTSPAILLIGVCLFCYQRLVESRRWRWILAAGFLTGFGAGVHPIILALAFVGAGWVMGQHRRGGLLLAIGLILATLVSVAPYSLWNYRFLNRWTLISTSGPVNFYAGNNRTAAGIGESNLAWEATLVNIRQGRTDFTTAALADIQADPGRWIQLLGRKFALAWADAEVANNTAYTEDRVRSPLLSAIPLGFSLVATLAFAGLYFQRTSSASWVVFAAAWALAAGMCIGGVLSRLRTPMVVALIPLAAVGVAQVLTEWRSPGKWLVPLAIAALVALAADRVTGLLPRPLVVSNIPNGYHSIGSIKGVTVYIPDSLPRMEPGIPYWVPVYWQVGQHLEGNYNTLVQVIDSHEQKWDQGDYAAGETSYPDYPTAQWQPGDIVKDEFLIIPSKELPVPFSAQIWIGLYDPKTDQRLPTTLPDGSTADVLKTETIAVTHSIPLTLPPGALQINATVGTAKLNAYTIQKQTLTLYWQAGEPMPQDGIVFIHLFDSQGNFVAGTDGRPRNGLYSTLAWQTGEGIVDEHLLPTVPAGDYTIKIGMYAAVTQNRLTVTDAHGQTLPDGVLPLGRITLP